MLLEPELRSRLDRLALATRGRIRGAWGGRHRSRRLGESLDFADYREYFPGDDYRRIDYTLWARLGVVLIRLFEAEDELPLRVLVDTSQSMDFGDKFPTAQRLSAMVAYLALASGERVQVASVPGEDSPRIQGPWVRHTGSWPVVESFLESLQPGGGPDLRAAANHVAAATGLRGASVLVSDLLTEGWEQAIDLLGVSGSGVVLQVISPLELDPDLTGDLTLRDVETRQEVPVSVSDGAVDRYRERVRGFIDEVANRSRRSGLDHVLAVAQPGVLDQTLAALVSSGVAR